MIHAAGDLGIWIDLGKDEPGMTLQRRERVSGGYQWQDYQQEGKTVKSPLDLDSLPAGKYRLVG